MKGQKNVDASYISGLIKDCESTINILLTMRKKAILLDEPTDYEDKRILEETEKIKKLTEILKNV